MAFLDTIGLKYFWSHIKSMLENKVDKENNKNLSTNDYTDEEKEKVKIAYNYVQEIQENIVLSVYPVGSIYINISDVDPSILFGGTWEKIKDMFLLSSGDIYEVGETGGEATHNLTIDEIPSHSHKNKYPAVGYTGNVAGYSWNINGDDWGYQSDEEVGGGLGHNNMPPYIAVCVYKRIA